MFRASFLSVFAIVTFALTIATAQSPTNDADARLAKALSVQTAMVRARSLLTDRNSQKAVEILEDQLPKVNGNPEYLALLRDAYRVYVKDLLAAGKFDQARRYRDRLCILDPNAARDPALLPQTAAVPRNFEPEPVKPAKARQFPTFKMPTLPNFFGKKEESKKPPLIVRGQAEDALLEDPFDRQNQRDIVAAKPSKTISAQELLARGAGEFKQKRYADARLSFEMAYQYDQKCLDACREQWAYCIIHGVTEAMDRPGAKLAELKQQVDGAISMAPGKFLATGQALLQQLDQRAKGQGRPKLTVTAVSVRHLGRNKEGWSVAETAHFRVFHRQDDDFAERIAQIAEGTRQTMYRKWFGHDGVSWDPVCELILHPNSASYTHMTGVPSNSPGHSRIESDASGRVISRRMDMRLDIHNMSETVLPHETTHVVLAGMFGPGPVPRWADEGIAVLSEPEEKIAQHRRNLFNRNQLFGLQELMELRDYPTPSRIPTFYAQSVVLAEFMTAQRGPKVFAEFVKDGMRHGYAPALQRHYSMTFAQLEQAWQQQVMNNPQRLAAQK